MKLAIALACLGLTIAAGQVVAYSDYTDSQCATCHSGFKDKGALHDVHQNALTNNCNMCHPNGAGSKPVSTSNAGDATTFSCLGCHGRDYGGTVGMQAAGLRLHHANSGISCSPCHDSDPAPLGENILPAHYGRADVTLVLSCDDSLDNDGDLSVDGDDLDCSTAVEESTWSTLKTLYID